ncbi:MAG: ligase-associated DNA damage response endonuclease PdeM [Flammeovirgaceae bacterium]|nr:ligase-associated DNA damage response endonuclease PdeM [Flammeovirgaceae bacterium]
MKLLSEKALFLVESKTLVIADLHFGKINHFRKSGIPVPTKGNKNNSERLVDLLNRTKPERTIFLGDLFHSHYNEEWEVLGQIIKHFSQCKYELVLGNHDILSTIQYSRNNINVVDQLVEDNIILTHEPMKQVKTGRYNLSGHLHPGVRLSGKGRQSMTLPCFYFGSSMGLLPAFGSFTGFKRIEPKKNDRIFVVADKKNS